jgi:hypothetical protein
MTNIHDLWTKHPKRKFEKLRGHTNRYSMRLDLVNTAWKWKWSGPMTEKTIGEFMPCGRLQPLRRLNL